MDNELLKAIKSLQSSIEQMNQRAGVDRLRVPEDLKPSARISQQERAKTLDAYTAAVFETPATTWTKEQKDLIHEQINNVLATL